MSVSSFNSRPYSTSSASSASDLPLRTNKFCSLLFVVVVHATGCDKYSFIDASRLCGKPHGRLSHLLFARPARHRSIAISYIADDRFGLRHLHSTPSLGGSLSKCCHDVWYRKTRMVWLPDGEKSDNVFIRFDRIHERDRQTDRRTDTA